MRIGWIVLLWGLWLGCGAFAQDRPAIARPGKPAKASSKAKEEKVGEEAAARGPAVDIGKILPEGRSLKGVKFPSYAGDRLSSLMTAITMKRLDEKHLDMAELRITMYAKPGEKDTLISTERGIYDLEKEEITSDKRTRIEQEGVFDLEGDDMIFDAVTQKGKMTGNVRMLLYQADQNLKLDEKKTDKEIGKERGTENEKG
jgi:hypothetical protein